MPVLWQACQNLFGMNKHFLSEEIILFFSWQKEARPFLVTVCLFAPVICSLRVYICVFVWPVIVREVKN